jgi:predicted metal-dependent hydrolase
MIVISIAEHLSPRQKERSAYSLARKLISQDHLIDLRWMVEELNRLHFNSRLNKVMIKEQTSSWGTCTPDNSIYLSFNSLFLPKHLLDYIIIHELAHTIEHNHSKKFWRLVENALPNYRQIRKEIKNNGLKYLPR